MITSIETVLVVDDDLLMREFVVETLTRAGIEVVQASNGAQARKLMEEREFDMAFVDIKMPVMSGMDLLRWKQGAGVATLTVMVTAFGTVEQAVEAMKLGAIDFLMKPFSPEQVEVVLKRAREWVQLNAQNDYLKEELGWTLPGGRQLLGQSPSMSKLLQQIERVAASSSTVLISGESGTGKELVAQAIHNVGEYRKRPFVRMNCAAVPEALADSELFGHEKGAFTGAINRRLGRFELAGNGTLLLDEISEMPLNLQAKLLRVIQEREFERVGGTRTLRTECRLIATTNRNLEQYVKAGGFRQDLYYRLNVVPIQVASLRERPEDIPVLANAFLERRQGKADSKAARLRFHPDTLALLARYPWPGNVRELEHLVERLCVMETGPELTPEMLPPEMRGTYPPPCPAPVPVMQPMASAPASPATPSEGSAAQPAPITDPHGDTSINRPPQASGETGDTTLNLDTLERQTILKALAQTGGQRNQAADILGVSIRTLRNKLTRYREEGTLPPEYA